MLLCFPDCLHLNSYEWSSQLRFYGENDIRECIIHQNMTHYPYGYEYIGNLERIIITPLTERYYFAKSNASYKSINGTLYIISRMYLNLLFAECF